MKKLFTILLFTIALTSITYAQKWVNFSNNKPNAPEINLLTSNAQTVSFEINIPGIYTLDTIVNSTAFTRLILPNGGPVNPVGAPEIPVLMYKIAIPECSAIDIAYTIVSQQNLTPCLVYPVPIIVPDNNNILVEQFTFDPVAYTQPRSGNEPAAVVYSSGSLRAQRYVEVMVCPVVYCPVSQQLSVIDKVEVTLTFTHPQGALRQNVGIFNKVATNAFINYKDDGISALVNDKAFEKADFVLGNVQWITLTDPAQADTIVADYLIITDSLFFKPNDPNSQITRLANHRAFYNGFDVVILNVEDILSDAVGFYYEGNPTNPNQPDKYKAEQRIRTCIRRIYEGKNALHTGDSCLAYVLLVGDNYEGNTGMPTSKDHNISYYGDSNDIYPSDYYFTCVTKDTNGMYDDVGDLFIGRLSVENNEHLFNMVQKTINHETEFSPESWRNKVGFTNGSVLDSLCYIYYYNFLIDILNEKEIDYSIVNYFDLNGEIHEPTLNYLNEGVIFSQYLGHGNSLSWSEANLNVDNLELLLNNAYKNPFLNAVTCESGMFDDHDCLAEFLTRDDSIKGAVGYIGASRIVWVALYPAPVDTNNLDYSERFPYYLFSKNISIAGELLWIAKLLINTEGYYLATINKHAYNLFGDPALNILATGYEITRNVTAECPAEIPCEVTVRNGATLTVPANCTLNILANGKLIVDEDGTLKINNGAHINGINNQSGDVMVIAGGGLSMGNNVQLNHLNNIWIRNRFNWPDPWSYSNKQYNFKHVTFNNTSLIHCGSNLNVSNCTFNAGSHLSTCVSKSTINNCTFNESTFLSAHSSLQLTPIFIINPFTNIKNCYFNGNNSNAMAISIVQTPKFNIENNTITDYETGISLTESGTSLLKDPTGSIINVIQGNEISNCSTGVEVYNAISYFKGNHIYENGFGVKLYNNSETAFVGSHPEHSIIRDNASYELYASTNTFPTIFQYNQIIDENNLGNSCNDPLIWLDVKNPLPAKKQDVTLNYWGENFDPNEDLYPSKAFKWNPVWEPDGKFSAPVPDSDESLYETALTYFSEKDYTNAETTFKDLIAHHSQSQFAIAALHELFALRSFTDYDYATLRDYYATFTPADSNLFHTADFLTTRSYVKEKFWQPAIDWYEYRIENPPSYQDSVFAVIDLGDIHLMMEGDTLGTKGHSACHYKLANIKPESKQEFEQNKTTLLATLPQIKKTHTSHPKPHTSKTGSVEQNVPNPVTGITTITYELYTEGAVEINIYNLSGQLVKSLSQGTQKEGKYQTTVSLVELVELPVGIYYYTLLVNGERVDAKKLVVNTL